MFFGFLSGHKGIEMHFLEALISGISLDNGVWMEKGLGFFEKSKVMLFPVGKSRTNDLGCLFVYYNLRFDGVAFFLPRVE